MRHHTRFRVLLGCFFLSGAAGLIYQVSWTRRFGLVFGTTELAIATVLAAFLGGLGLGAAIVARYGRRVRRTLLLFGFLELTIALSALAIPASLVLVRRLYMALLGGATLPVAAGGVTSTAFYLGASLVILVIPTACMGATLPILARFAVREDAHVGLRVGLLYAVNTAGAVAGAVATGFVLLPTLGLEQTTWVAVAINATVFALAVFLGRGNHDAPAASRDAPVLASSEPSPTAVRRAERPAAHPAATATATPALRRAVPWLVAGSGFLALGYEVLWTRLLSHLIGGSIEAFATMLGSFLVGIAGGSWLAARRAQTPAAGARGLVTAQIGAGVSAVISFMVIGALPGQLELFGGRASAALAAGIALLPGAIAMGATFPFAVRALTRNASEASTATARVYTWNTAGAVAGALLAGFFLLSALGFASTLTLLAGGNLALAMVAAWCIGRPARRSAVVAAILLGALLVWRPATPWRLLRHVPLPHTQPDTTSVVTFHAVGRSATVLLLDDGSEWYLRTNGLPEGTIQPPGLPPGRYLVTPWLGALPTMLRPETDRLLVIGLGAGVVLETVPPTVSEIDLIEIEPQVIAANRAVAGLRRHDPLADPRLRLITNDARSALLLTDRRYDAIVSQPSHPWTGSGHLYSREFFALAHDRLTADGVFVQWIGLGALDEALLAVVIATVADAFPEVAVFWPPGGNALLLVGSSSPLDWPRTTLRALDIAGDSLAVLGVSSPEDLGAALMLDDAGARRLAAGAAINTDDDNRLQARSARVLSTGLGGKARAVLERYDPWSSGISPSLDGRRLVQRLLETGQGARAQRLLTHFHDLRDRNFVQALVAQASGRARLARTLADAVIASDPRDADGRALLLKLFRGAVARGSAPPARLLPLTAEEQTVVAGWRAAHRGDLRELRSLDHALAAIAPATALYPQALRLRAAWRAHDADPEVARAAQDLLAILVARGGDSETTLLLAHAAVGAGHRRAALATLEDLARHLDRGNRGFRAQIGTILSQLGTARDPAEAARLDALRGRFVVADDHRNQ